MLTPVRRFAILFGHMVADIAVACMPDGADPRASGFAPRRALRDRAARASLAFIALAALWSLAFAGFGYAIALKTGNPAAVQHAASCCSSRSCSSRRRTCRAAELSGWLDTVAAWNPVTYLLEGMRSLTMVGWDADAIGQALLAVGIVAPSA